MMRCSKVEVKQALGGYQGCCGDKAYSLQWSVSSDTKLEAVGARTFYIGWSIAKVFSLSCGSFLESAAVCERG